jgi:uncharacterized protein YkwD
MKKLSILAILLTISIKSLSQDQGLTEMALKRFDKEMAKRDAQYKKDSVYFANYELDSVKLTNAILSELNKERKAKHLKTVTCSSDSSQCAYVMNWSKHLSETGKIGHGGTNLYNAEVAFGGFLHKSEAGVDSQYALIAHDAIQKFMDSPEHKRLIMTPDYNKVVIGFGHCPGLYSTLSVVIVIGLIDGSQKH